MFMFRCLLIVIQLVWPVVLWGDTISISPLNYGLNECISDIQRYYVLQEVHADAVKKGCEVDYTGIDTISIEIPRDAKPLPLTDYTNFGGVVINVKNQSKYLILFQMTKQVEPMDVTWNQIIKGKIDDKRQDCLILIEDMEPWVKNRMGYSYGHTRKDILLVKDGQIKNQVVASYGTASSKPKFSRCNISIGSKIIKNLTITRDMTSTYITTVFSIDNQNDIEIQNVTINTPSAGELYGDAAINVKNCTNVRFKDVTINGTYSQRRKYGYGI